jgi:hypothetical protein
MKATRRQVLVGAGLGAATIATRVGAEASAKTLIFDSRFPESVAFARRNVGVSSIDVAVADDELWASFRSIGKGRVSGLTGWSDWVIARGFLEERGLRLVAEEAVDAPVSGAAHLFRWTMA